jgi:hypothetical protein
MADMCRFVGIDIRMLDDDFARRLRLNKSTELPPFNTPGKFESERAAIEMNIQIAAARHIYFSYPWNSLRIRCKLLRYLDGGAANLSGEIKSYWERQFPQLNFRRDGGVQRVIMNLISLVNMAPQGLFKAAY